MCSVRPMAMGQTIRTLRQARGWKLEDLAEASGVDMGTISALEVRDSNRSKYFPQLARALGYTVEQLSRPDFIIRGTDGAVHVLEVKQDPWPFTTDLHERVGQLDRVAIDRLENVMRAHLDMPLLPPTAADRRLTAKVLQDAKGLLDSEKPHKGRNAA